MITTTAHNDYLKITRINLTDFCKGTEGLIHWQQHHGRKGGWQLPLNFSLSEIFFLPGKFLRKSICRKEIFTLKLRKPGWTD